MATCMAFLSASLYTATVLTPRRRAVLITRHAISPRLATSSLSNNRTSSSAELEAHWCLINLEEMIDGYWLMKNNSSTIESFYMLTCDLVWSVKHGINLWSCVLPLFFPRTERVNFYKRTVLLTFYPLYFYDCWHSNRAMASRVNVSGLGILEGMSGTAGGEVIKIPGARSEFSWKNKSYTSSQSPAQQPSQQE